MYVYMFGIVIDRDGIINMWIWKCD